MNSLLSVVVLISVLYLTDIIASDLDQVYIYFVYGPNTQNQVKYCLTSVSDVLDHPLYNASKVTALYVHGYMESLNKNSTQTVIRSYLINGNFNTLVLDWGDLAAGLYTTAVANVVKVGKSMANVLVQIIESNRMSPDKLHLVGHSLGGQMVGVIGRNVQTQSNGQITLDRITALDPAGPLFTDSNVSLDGLLVSTINVHDANFVDIIHTDAGQLGFNAAGGHVDFWPNGGIAIQPGCPILPINLIQFVLCSHQRSWWFFSASLVTSGADVFKSIAANNWSDFKKGKTNSCNIATMGVNVQRTATGNYYLKTGATFPFSLGVAGIHY